MKIPCKLIKNFMPDRRRHSDTPMVRIVRKALTTAEIFCAGSWDSFVSISVQGAHRYPYM